MHLSIYFWSYILFQSKHICAVMVHKCMQQRIPCSHSLKHVAVSLQRWLNCGLFMQATSGKYKFQVFVILLCTLITMQLGVSKNVIQVINCRATSPKDDQWVQSMQLTARNNIELSSYEPVSFASQKPFTISARNSLCFTKIRYHANLENPALPLQSSHPNCSISLSLGRKSSLSSLASTAAEIEYLLQNLWQEIGR